MLLLLVMSLLHIASSHRKLSRLILLLLLLRGWQLSRPLLHVLLGNLLLWWERRCSRVRSSQPILVRPVL